MSSAMSITVPVVRSTGNHGGSRLFAAIGMAIAYVRGDGRGDSYRDLLELCHRNDVSLDVVLAATRRLFPDVPLSDYGQDEIELDDLVLLARHAAQRGGRLLPVLVYDERFHPDVARAHLHAVVLETFDLHDQDVRVFWGMGAGVDAVPAGFQALVFGWMPARGTDRNLRLDR